MVVVMTSKSTKMLAWFGPYRMNRAPTVMMCEATDGAFPTVHFNPFDVLPDIQGRRLTAAMFVDAWTQGTDLADHPLVAAYLETYRAAPALTASTLLSGS